AHGEPVDFEMQPAELGGQEHSGVALGRGEGLRLDRPGWFFGGLAVEPGGGGNNARKQGEEKGGAPPRDTPRGHPQEENGR
ncbi:hypothetical protein, partial [Pseudomonas syringae group genomosp. 7]|uniref:hypothetical protein n=1 Tax=Pseudomonas syringae group genomosp. 7 TaxID=251699 RepID=UPI00376F6412